jgi:hypothetical protein
MTFLWLCALVAALASPCPIIPQANCVTDMNHNASAVELLSTSFKDPSACADACTNANTTCHSWTFYYPDSPQNTYRGHCYGRNDLHFSCHKNIPLTKNHVCSGVNCKHPPPTPAPSPTPLPSPTPPPLAPTPVPLPPVPTDPSLLPVAYLGTGTEEDFDKLCRFQVVAIIDSPCWVSGHHQFCYALRSTQSLSIHTHMRLYIYIHTSPCAELHPSRRTPPWKRGEYIRAAHVSATTHLLYTHVCVLLLAFLLEPNHHQPSSSPHLSPPLPPPPPLSPSPSESSLLLLECAPIIRMRRGVSSRSAASSRNSAQRCVV